MSGGNAWKEYVKRGMYPDINRESINNKNKSAEDLDCPINLDKIHCQSCYFNQDGKCNYEEMNYPDLPICPKQMGGY